MGSNESGFVKPQDPRSLAITFCTCSCCRSAWASELSPGSWFARRLIRSGRSPISARSIISRTHVRRRPGTPPASPILPLGGSDRHSCARYRRPTTWARRLRCASRLLLVPHDVTQTELVGDRASEEHRLRLRPDALRALRMTRHDVLPLPTIGPRHHGVVEPLVALALRP